MSEAMPPAVKYLAVSLVICAVLIAGSLAAVMMSTSPRESGGIVVEGMAPLPFFEDVVFPDFAGLSQTSAPVDASVLDGEVTIVDFIFTHCPLICPVVSSRMMEQATALEGTGVRLLSISVDPAHDTPEVLAAFASRYDADAARWLFVQAPMEDVLRIGDAMGFTLHEDESNQVPISADETMANIIHPVSLLLIGPDRRVYGRYHYKDPNHLAQLTEDARRLAGQR